MMIKLLLVGYIFLRVFGANGATVTETSEVKANKNLAHGGAYDSLPSPTTVSSNDVHIPVPSSTLKPAHRVYRQFPATTYTSPPQPDYQEYTSPGYAIPPTVNPHSYGTTTTTTTPPPTFSIQQIMHLLEMIRDSDAFDYLFPSHYYSRSEPNTCGCGEEIQQLQHAILLLQESVRQLRIFVHADEISKYSDIHKKGPYK